MNILIGSTTNAKQGVAHRPHIREDIASVDAKIAVAVAIGVSTKQQEEIRPKNRDKKSPGFHMLPDNPIKTVKTMESSMMMFMNGQNFTVLGHGPDAGCDRLYALSGSAVTARLLRQQLLPVRDHRDSDYNCAT